MNRGLSRRTIFEGTREMRAFLALCAREVRGKRLEIHAFCLLSTHFHLLVRSPKGELSEAMRQIENRYVRWFNRRHRRDGPLFRGRFRSKQVEGELYRSILVRYIDENPVLARLVLRAEQYRFGSASVWHAGDRRPWLARAWIGRELAPYLARGDSIGQAYSRVFGASLTDEHRSWVELHHRNRHCGDDLAVFASGAPERVREWMLRKARLADGSRPGLPVTGMDSARRALAHLEPRLAGIRFGTRQTQIGAAELIETMLLRDLCGMPWQEVGRACGVSLTAAHYRYQLHRTQFALAGNYAETAVEAAQRAIKEFSGSQTLTRED